MVVRFLVMNPLLAETVGRQIVVLSAWKKNCKLRHLFAARTQVRLRKVGPVMHDVSTGIEALGFTVEGGCGAGTMASYS